MMIENGRVVVIVVVCNVVSDLVFLIRSKMVVVIFFNIV